MFRTELEVQTISTRNLHFWSTLVEKRIGQDKLDNIHGWPTVADFDRLYPRTPLRILLFALPENQLSNLILILHQFIFFDYRHKLFLEQLFHTDGRSYLFSKDRLIQGDQNGATAASLEGQEFLATLLRYIQLLPDEFKPYFSAISIYIFQLPRIIAAQNQTVVANLDISLVSLRCQIETLPIVPISLNISPLMYEQSETCLDSEKYFDMSDSSISRIYLSKGDKPLAIFKNYITFALLMLVDCQTIDGDWLPAGTILTPSDAQIAQTLFNNLSAIAVGSGNMSLSINLAVFLEMINDDNHLLKWVPNRSLRLYSYKDDFRTTKYNPALADYIAQASLVINQTVHSS